MTPSRQPTETVDLLGLTNEKLERFIEQDLGLQPYRGRQVFRWIHGRMETDFAAMTDLAKPVRQTLASRCVVSELPVHSQLEGEDGTTKLALATRDGHLIETVMIPEGDKLTQCISTQVGCRMGCRFCATARLGLRRHLTPGEIVAQTVHGRRWAESHGRRITNLVYMGMGEPLDNFEATTASLQILMHSLGMNMSSRRITLSTVGHIPGLQRLAKEPFQVNLALSLNATTQKTRAEIMPAAKRWPLSELLDALAAFPLEKRRRITLEYVLISGINDTDADAGRLVRIAHRLRAKVNLIPLNPFEGCTLAPPDMAHTERFAESVRSRNVTVLLRKSRGADIQAACGQLAGKLQPKAEARF